MSTNKSYLLEIVKTESKQKSNDLETDTELEGLVNFLKILQYELPLY